MRWETERIKEQFEKRAGVKDWLRRQLSKGFKSLPKQHQRGFARQGMKAGIDSFVAWPAMKVMGRIKGVSRTRKGAWKNIQLPALSVDISTGKALNRAAKTLTPFNKAFIIKEKIPLSAKTFKEVERYSAMAPLTKSMGIASPFLVAGGIEQGLSAVLDKKKQEKFAMDKMAYVNKEAMNKMAKEMLRLKEENVRLSQVKEGQDKGARALELLYKQAEAGLGQIPGTHKELLEKVASLTKQDLDVVEKAIELSGGGLSLGQLGSEDLSNTKSTTPEGQFALTLIGEDAY